MSKIRLLALAVAVCMATGARAQIGPQHIPADAKWVLNLDLKALNAAPMGAFLRQTMDAEALRGLGSLKALSGIDLTNDVDSVVAYGKGDAKAGGVLYAFGRFDIAKLTAVAGGAKEFQNKAFGERSLLSWSDKGKRNHLCFADPTLAVMSQDELLVQEAVGLVDGRTAAGAGGSFGKVLENNKSRFFALQASNLSALAGTNPQMQLFKQADAVMLEIGQAAGANGLDCALSVKAATPEMAQQMSQAAMGIQALFQLQAAQNPEAAALAQSAKVGMQDTFVTVSLKVPEELIKKQMAARREQAAAARAARQAARQAKAEAKAKADRPAF
jgi:hypothetical protein